MQEIQEEAGSGHKGKSHNFYRRDKMVTPKVRILVFPKWIMHRRPFYPLAFSSVRFTVAILRIGQPFKASLLFFASGKVVITV